MSFIFSFFKLLFFKLLSLIQFSSKSSSVYFWGKFSTFTLATNFESFESHYISAHQISKQSKEPMKNPPFILIAIHLHENIIQGFCCLYRDGLGEDLNPGTTGWELRLTLSPYLGASLMSAISLW